MYATKRKFHNILSSLTSNASTSSLSSLRQPTNASTTTLPADIESKSKKRRVGSRPRSEIASQTERPKTSHGTALAGVHSSPESKPVPNYAPWDRNQFLRRLKTFRHVDKWSAKPPIVNEVQWAKRGWSCVGKERVRCVGGCGKEVLIKLEAEGPSHIQDQEGDENDWNVGVETIYRLPLASPPISLAALSTRYASLISMAGDLPSNLSAPDDLDTLHLAKQVSVEFLLSHSPSPSAADSLQPSDSVLNYEAFVLAFFGWQAETGHIAGLATCEACFRRLGLWLFKAKTPEDASMSRLDVIGEHRDYCPWVNSFSQSGGGLSKNQNKDSSDQKAGWEVLLWALKGALHLYSQSSNAAAPLSSPRNNINDATDGESNTNGRTEKATSTMSRDEQDKERWARLKKLKRVFDVKGRKKGAVKATARPEIPTTQVVQSNE